MNVKTALESCLVWFIPSLTVHDICRHMMPFCACSTNHFLTCDFKPPFWVNSESKASFLMWSIIFLKPQLCHFHKMRFPKKLFSFPPWRSSTDPWQWLRPSWKLKAEHSQFPLFSPWLKQPSEKTCWWLPLSSTKRLDGSFSPLLSAPPSPKNFWPEQVNILLSCEDFRPLTSSSSHPEVESCSAKSGLLPPEEVEDRSLWGGELSALQSEEENPSFVFKLLSSTHV